MNSENEKLRALLKRLYPSVSISDQVRIDEALSQQAEQPPVAWLWEYLGTHLTADKEQADWLQSNGVELQALYAAPIAQVEQWISVEERLPSIAQEVIVNTEFEGVCAGVLDSYMEWYAPCSDYKLTRVTHWLPLPSPPTP